MTVGRYSLGCLELVAVLVPVIWAATQLRATAMPGFTGATARLAEVAVILSWLVVETELLGVFGALRGPALAGASLVSGAAVSLGLAGRRQRDRSAGPPDRNARRPAHMTWQAVAVTVAVGLVASEQVAVTLRSLRGGISEFDSLAYHLPTAARWVQDGSLSAIHQLYPGSLWAYYPYNAEILHAIGMAAFGRDLLSPLLNLGFVALVFLAAWSIGSARKAGSSAVLAAAMVLATYQFSEIGGGTALNDIPAVAMVLTMVALAARATRPGELAAAALAGGWAIGTKPDAALTVLVVALGAIVLARGRRVTATVTWIAGLLVAGGYWYIRNLVTVQTPLPGLHTGILPTPRAFPWPLTFADGLRSGVDSLSALPHDLNAALGPTWPVVVTIALLGLVTGLARNRAPWERAAALGGVANIAIWPFTPFTEVVFFAVRYMAPGLLLGAILFASAPTLAGARRQLAASCFLAATAAVATAHEYSAHLSDRIVALLAALLVGGLSFLLIRVPGRRLPLAAIALAAVAVVAVAEPEAQRYLRSRYNLADFSPQSSDAVALARVFSWVRGVHHARIGVEGGELQYPLYGSDLSNHVQYIGSTRPDGGFMRIERCGLWRRAINAGHYSYVMTVPWGSESGSPPMPSPQEDWMRTDPAAVPVLEPGGGIVLFAIHGSMRGC